MHYIQKCNIKVTILSIIRESHRKMMKQKVNLKIEKSLLVRISQIH